MSDEFIGDELGSIVAKVYAGPLDDFVQRRDTLVKELRAAGRREDAATVKRLCKPTRTAWALNTVSRGNAPAMQRVEAMVAATVAAQSGGGDLRAALAGMRDAVHDLAGEATRAASSVGYAVDRVDLVDAIMAVIGTHASIDMLRAGHLVDIPEAGGLEFLTGFAPPTLTATDEPAAELAVEESAAREASRLAEIALAAARERSATADGALRNAEANLENAEQQVQAAQRDLLARQAERERARERANEAAEQVFEAEKAMSVHPTADD